MSARPTHNRPVPRLDLLAFAAVMTGGLVFHFVYCLVPSLRYFNARPGAYIIGAAAYGLVASPLIADALGVALSPELLRAWFVVTVVVLTMAAWRPYAFVRAGGGPRIQAAHSRIASDGSPLPRTE